MAGWPAAAGGLDPQRAPAGHHLLGGLGEHRPQHQVLLGEARAGPPRPPPSGRGSGGGPGSRRPTAAEHLVGHRRAQAPRPAERELRPAPAPSRPSAGRHDVAGGLAPRSRRPPGRPASTRAHVARDGRPTRWRPRPGCATGPAGRGASQAGPERRRARRRPARRPRWRPGAGGRRGASAHHARRPVQGRRVAREHPGPPTSAARSVSADGRADTRATGPADGLHGRGAPPPPRPSPTAARARRAPAPAPPRAGRSPRPPPAPATPRAAGRQVPGAVGDADRRGPGEGADLPRLLQPAGVARRRVRAHDQGGDEVGRRPPRRPGRRARGSRGR